MKRVKKDYRLSLDDETRLERIFRMRLTWPRVLLGALCAIALSVLVGVLIVAVTPLRHLMPGYLDEPQRTAGEETLLRLDSIRNAYETDRRYLDNLRTVMDLDRPSHTDSLGVSMQGNSFTADSLIDVTKRERDFVRHMQETEKYNITVLAPLDAESVDFNPPTDQGVVTTATLRSPRAVITVPSGSTLTAIADGTVLSATRSPRSCTLIMQHPQGFVSRMSGIGRLVVDEGDYLYGGQAVGLASAGSSGTSVALELWHDGARIVPAEYITPHKMR